MKQQDRIIYYRLLVAAIEQESFANKSAKQISTAYALAIERAALSLDHFINNLKVTSLDDVTEKRLILLIDALVKQLEVFAPDLAKDVVSPSVDNAIRQAEATYMALSFEEALDSVSNVVLTAAQLQSLIFNKEINGYDLEEWAKRSLIAPWKDVQANIVAGMIQGQGASKIVSTLRSLAADAEKSTIRNINTLVRSYVLGSGTAARHKVYDANRGMIEKYEWNAALEAGSKSGAGTCPRCAALDGHKWDKRGDAPTIPLHPNCRCVLVPITKDIEIPGFDWDKEEAEALKEVEEAWYTDKSGYTGQYGKSRPTKSIAGIPDYVKTNKDYSAWVTQKGNEKVLERSIGRKKAEWVNSFSNRKKAFEHLVVFDDDYKKLVNKVNKSLPMKERRYRLKPDGEKGTKRIYTGYYNLGDQLNMEVLEHPDIKKQIKGDRL
jgi:Tfp pilus assembly major pilin PilA